jgi:ankyrin repeat protein
VEAEKELREAVNEESRQRIKQSREETEQRLRAQADERMKHERERLEKQMERRLKEMEHRLRDEHDLKDAGYDPGDSKNSATKALIAAVQTKQELRIILLLLAKGGNPVSCIHMHKPRGALHMAAWVGYIDAIQIFLKHGADPNAKDEDGVPPLAYAASEPAARM